MTPTRCFFAVWPPVDARGALAAEAAHRALSEEGRLVPVGNLHLTLAFVGGVAEERLVALMRIAAGVVVPAFDLVLDQHGRFDRAGVGWIAPSEVPRPLVDLHRQLADGCRRAGFAVEDRTYRPHVTLLRSDPRRRRGSARQQSSPVSSASTPISAPGAPLSTPVSAAGGPSSTRVSARGEPSSTPVSAAGTPPGPASIGWPVRDFALVASRSAAGGPIYTSIGCWPLR